MLVLESKQRRKWVYGLRVDDDRIIVDIDADRIVYGVDVQVRKELWKDVGRIPCVGPTADPRSLPQSEADLVFSEETLKQHRFDDIPVEVTTDSDRAHVLISIGTIDAQVHGIILSDQVLALLSGEALVGFYAPLKLGL